MNEHEIYTKTISDKQEKLLFLRSCVRAVVVPVRILDVWQQILSSRRHNSVYE